MMLELEGKDQNAFEHRDGRWIRHRLTPPKNLDSPRYDDLHDERRQGGAEQMGA